MLDPLEPFLDEVHNFNEPLYYQGILDLAYHVEDMNKRSLYELLIQNWLNEDINFKVFACYNGKKGVTKASQENTDTACTHVFLIDKDFNDKFPDEADDKLNNMCLNDIKNINGIVILGKYSIENYLISKCALKKYLQIKGESKDDFLFNHVDNIVDETIEKCLELTHLFLFNRMYNLNNTYNIKQLLNDDLSFKENQPETYIQSLKNQFAGDNFHKILNTLKNSVNENDVIGKEVLKLLKSRLGLNCKDKEYINCLASCLCDYSMNELKNIIVPEEFLDFIN